MNAGDTFLVDEPATSYDSHLWMVVSAPERDRDRVVILNLTSWRADKDQACVLEPGDHPYVRHRSCVRKRSRVAERPACDRIRQKRPADALCQDRAPQQCALQARLPSQASKPDRWNPAL